MSERERQQFKMIGIEYAFLYFKMSEFAKSLRYL